MRWIRVERELTPYVDPRTRALMPIQRIHRVSHPDRENAERSRSVLLPATRPGTPSRQVHPADHRTHLPSQPAGLGRGAPLRATANPGTTDRPARFDCALPSTIPWSARGFPHIAIACEGACASHPLSDRLRIAPQLRGGHLRCDRRRAGGAGLDRHPAAANGHPWDSILGSRRVLIYGRREPIHEALTVGYEPAHVLLHAQMTDYRRISVSNETEAECCLHRRRVPRPGHGCRRHRLHRRLDSRRSRHRESHRGPCDHHGAAHHRPHHRTALGCPWLASRQPGSLSSRRRH